MIIAFKKGLFLESLEHTGSLEFFLEAGSHTILPIDFLGELTAGNRKSPFKNYEGP
jgi:hypothetical protein